MSYNCVVIINVFMQSLLYSSHGDDHKLQPEDVAKPTVKTRPANLRFVCDDLSTFS